METVLTYRGRAIELADVAFIRALIAARPKASRRRLSLELCRAWGWVQPNGALRDAVCRGLLLALHRGGHIELPVPKLPPAPGLPDAAPPLAPAMSEVPSPPAEQASKKALSARALAARQRLGKPGPQKG